MLEKYGTKYRNGKAMLCWEIYCGYPTKNKNYPSVSSYKLYKLLKIASDYLEKSVGCIT